MEDSAVKPTLRAWQPVTLLLQRLKKRPRIARTQSDGMGALETGGSTAAEGDRGDGWQDVRLPPLERLKVRAAPALQQQPAIAPPPTRGGIGERVGGSVITLHSEEEGVDGLGGGGAVGASRRPPPVGGGHRRPPPPAGLSFAFPPNRPRNSVEVRADDLARLEPGILINDTAIDFYMRWLQDGLEARDPAAAARCYFFNGFLYKKLIEKNDKVPALAPDSQGLRHEAELAAANYPFVSKWTKDVDLFDKDFLFVPIHDNLHWSLMIVCHPGVEPRKAGVGSGEASSRAGPSTGEGSSSSGRTRRGAGTGAGGAPPKHPRCGLTAEPFIMHLDSMPGGHATAGTAAVLRQYLTDEWRSKKAGRAADGAAGRSAAAHPRTFTPTNCQVIKPKVPAQTNDYDCGLFVMAFVEHFVGAVPPTLNVAAVRASLAGGSAFPGFLTSEWFLPAAASNLVWDLRKMVLIRMGMHGGLLDDRGQELHGHGATGERAEMARYLVAELQAVQAARRRGAS